MTRLVLTNAIYFKGNWASQFKEDRTRDDAFTLLDGSKVQVPMMNQRAEFGYAETDRLQVLEMPYVGEELSMVVLLPKKPDGIGQLEKDLTVESLTQWLDRLRSGRSSWPCPSSR
jgi:serine protease inhibitor